MSALSKMLRLYRASEGIEQKDLASKIGIGASSLCRIENGKSPDIQGGIKIMKWIFK